MDLRAAFPILIHNKQPLQKIIPNTAIRIKVFCRPMLTIIGLTAYANAKPSKEWSAHWIY
jgi:hypothetical protein